MFPLVAVRNVHVETQLGTQAPQKAIVTLAGTPERNVRRVQMLLPLVPLGFVAYALVLPEAWVRGDMIANELGAGGASVVLRGPDFPSRTRNACSFGAEAVRF